MTMPELKKFMTTDLVDGCKHNSSSQKLLRTYVSRILDLIKILLIMSLKI